MAPCSARKQEKPYFFKVIFADTVEDGRIAIPKKFVRLYGNSLWSSVFLHVPFGEVWQVELSNHDDNLWLENGWRQFAAHHSVEEGHIIFFKYIGSSRFKVSICDQSDTEIACPPSQVEPTYYLEFGVFEESQIETESDDGFQILEEVTRRKGKKKGKRTGDSGLSPTLQRLPPRVVTKILKLLKDQNVAMQKALAFETDNPFFLLVMSPAYINEPKQVGIPVPFVKDYFPGDEGNVILQVAGGSDTKWTLKYKIYDEIQKCQMKSGWRSFVWNNNLQLDDICMFELVESSDLTLKVTIYRGIEIANCHREKRDSGLSPTLQRLPPRVVTKILKLLKDQNVAMQKALAFETDNPFFLLVMSPAYINEPKQVGIPVPFVKDYFPGDEGNVILQVAGGSDTKWTLKYKIYDEIQKCQMKSGWRSFVWNNNLQSDDICMFELVESSDLTLKVTIYRGIEIANCHREKRDSGLSPTLQRLPPRVVTKILKLLKDQNVAMQKALAFETDNPFFLLVMSPAYINEPKQVGIPVPFVKDYFPGDEGNVILQVAGGSDTKWTLKYKIYDEIQKCQMSSGWRSFVWNNNLQLDDICMFELVESSDLTLKVTIYRRIEIANCHREKGPAERFVVKRKRKEGCRSKALARFRPTANMIPVDLASQEALQAANSFRSDHPFFRVVMQTGHMRGENLTVPNNFCRMYFPGALKTLQLRVGEFVWPVKLEHFRDRARQFSVGWPEFVTENHLQPGNICVFELMTTSPTMIQVTIFR